MNFKKGPPSDIINLKYLSFVSLLVVEIGDGEYGKK